MIAEILTALFVAQSPAAKTSCLDDGAVAALDEVVAELAASGQVLAALNESATLTESEKWIALSIQDSAGSMIQALVYITDMHLIARTTSDAKTKKFASTRFAGAVSLTGNSMVGRLDTIRTGLTVATAAALVQEVRRVLTLFSSIERRLARCLPSPQDK